jgi:hypothetical protein
MADSHPAPLTAIPAEEVEARLPGYHDHVGRPLKYPAEVVEAALYEVAAHGNNVARACEALKDRGITQSYPEDCGRAIPRAVVSDWVRKRFRNRYHEIVSSSTRQLEEVVAQKGIETAIQIGEAEQQALRQTMAGLPDATAVEASQILRNLTQSKAQQIDKAHAVRAFGVAERTSHSLEQLVTGLKSLGLIVGDDDNIHDAEVIEDDAEMAELPAGE